MTRYQKQRAVRNRLRFSLMGRASQAAQTPVTDALNKQMMDAGENPLTMFCKMTRHAEDLEIQLAEARADSASPPHQKGN